MGHICVVSSWLNILGEQSKSRFEGELTIQSCELIETEVGKVKTIKSYEWSTRNHHLFCNTTTPTTTKSPKGKVKEIS